MFDAIFPNSLKHVSTAKFADDTSSITQTQKQIQPVLHLNNAIYSTQSLVGICTAFNESVAETVTLLNKSENVYPASSRSFRTFCISPLP